MNPTPFPFTVFAMTTIGPLARRVVGDRGEDGEQRVHVVAVDDDHLPPERRPLVCQRLEPDDVLDDPVEAVLVAVDDRDQVARPPVGRRHGRLPDLPLVQLPVAEQDVDVVVVAGKRRRERHPQPGRERVAERPRAEVDAWDAAHVGVVSEGAAEAGVPVEVARREVVEAGEQRVERDGRVALSEQEPVATGPVRLAAAEPKNAVVEHGEDLGTRKRRGVVTRLRDRDQPHGLLPQEPRASADDGRIGAHALSLVHQLRRLPLDRRRRERAQDP